MRSKYSVAIIGGGVIGCSIAYHLSEDFGEDVVLLEKEFIASGSSGLSAGILSQQLWDAVNTDMVRRSIDWIGKKSEDDEALVLNRNGLLRVVCTEEEIEPLRKNVDLQRRHGCDVRYLEPDEVPSITPEIAVDDIRGGAFCPDDAYVDPYQLCISLARDAEASGVRFYQKSEVRKVERDNNGFHLKTSKDSFESETVIGSVVQEGGQDVRHRSSPETLPYPGGDHDTVHGRGFHPDGA